LIVIEKIQSPSESKVSMKVGAVLLLLWAACWGVLIDSQWELLLQQMPVDQLGSSAFVKSLRQVKQPEKVLKGEEASRTVATVEKAKEEIIATTASVTTKQAF
jgi:hypothetical protein